MKKTLTLAIIVVALIVGAWLVFRPFSAFVPMGNSNQSNTSLPVAGSVSPATSPERASQQDPHLIPSADFLSKPDTYRDPVNAGYYSLGYPVGQTGASSSTPPYLITYIAATQFFIIELLQEPIGETRAQAELYLEQYLGLGPNDLCNLNYTLSVPVSVTKTYAGENLGFSFCAGATTLPK